MAGACGSCTACCRVFNIAELKKPAGKWCQHCAIGVGCQIYNQRPQTCVTYECMWLQSQHPDAVAFKPELRPDRCKVIFSGTTNERVISGTTMPGYPDAWKKPDVKWLIDILIEGGMAVAIGPPASTRITLIDKYQTREVSMSEPDEHGIQWNLDKV